MATSTTYTVPVDGIGPVPVTVTERGQEVLLSLRSRRTA